MRRTPMTVLAAFGGVLIAGTATALVNAHVLRVGDADTGTLPALAIPPPTTSVSTTAEAVAGAPRIAPPVPVTTSTATAPPVVETTTTTTTTPPTTAAPLPPTTTISIPAPAPPAANVVDIAAGEAGTIQVAVSSSGFDVVDALAQDGWSVDSEISADTVESADGTRRVRFRRSSDGAQIECELRLVDGAVVGEIVATLDRLGDRSGRDDDAGAPVTTAPVTPPPVAPAPSPDGGEWDRDDWDRDDDRNSWDRDDWDRDDGSRGDWDGDADRDGGGDRDRRGSDGGDRRGGPGWDDDD